MPTHPRKRRRRTVVVALAAILTAVGAFAAVSCIKPLLVTSGCQAGAGKGAFALDTQQAAIAATIAGVAHQRAMPVRAVTVALAAAMQESKMHNLAYGDRDSIGVFQQRPSEGWGPASKLRDPVYATSRFFQALERVPSYQTKPVYQAAQAVQHSADGLAYVQYEREAASLAAIFTGQAPHAVWCWSQGPAKGNANIAAAKNALVKTFGSLGANRIATPGDAPSMVVRPGQQPDLGWEVASWLVTHAARYRIHLVSFGGFQWRATAGDSGWTRQKAPASLHDVKAN